MEKVTICPRTYTRKGHANTHTHTQHTHTQVEVAAQEIKVELVTICHDPNHSDGDNHQGDAPGAEYRGVEGLAASLSALRTEFSNDIRAAYQDAPDLDCDIGDGSSSSGDPPPHSVHGEESTRGEGSRRSVRSNLERLIEKALGATRLALERVQIRVHMRSPLASAHQPPLATLCIDMDALTMTNNKDRLDGNSAAIEPGKLVSKNVCVYAHTHTHIHTHTHTQTPI